jgi:hypothetical protein
METLYSYLGYYKPDPDSKAHFETAILPEVTQQSPVPHTSSKRELPSWAVHQYILSHQSPTNSPASGPSEPPSWAVKEFTLAQEVKADHTLKHVDLEDFNPLRPWVIDEYEQKKQARYPLIVYLGDMSHAPRKKPVKVSNVPKWAQKEYLLLKWKRMTDLATLAGKAKSKAKRD